MPEHAPDPLIDVPVDPAADRLDVDEAFFDRIYDAREVLQVLRSRPLLGPDRRDAAGRIRQVAALLQELPDDLASADLFRVAGDLALDAGHGEAVDRYLRGAAAARRRGDTVRERDLHLRACRAVARMRGPEAALGFFRELGHPPDEPCPVTHALASADVYPREARNHLEGVLPLLTSDDRAHERLMALEDLAETYLAGNEPGLARSPLVEAIALAERFDDAGRATLAHALTATIHLTSGQPDLAIGPLERAFGGAVKDEDDLLVVTYGTVLTGLYLERERWEDAEPVARRLLASAERRGNWIAVADGALAWSATFVGQDQPAAAVAVVARTLLTLRARGASSAAALLHARLGELRVLMGVEAFDPVLRRVMQALQRLR